MTMSVLDRLAHARALDRLAPRPSVRVGSSLGASLGPPSRPAAAFERRELVIDLAIDLARGPKRGFGETATGPRSGLLGGCLARVPLPSAPMLARDLVCLGAREAGRAVFIDTETTGLGGVSMAFVVGLAWVEDTVLRCVQWTLSRCSGEAELLADVLAQLEALGPAPLVSFNGASFDLPLLRLRGRRYGLSARVLEAEHVDLLHPARRLHKGRSRDCKLSTLERDLLNLRRRDDIDAAEIPEVFWSWVQSPNDVRIRRRRQAVCDHNIVDLASLPALASWLAQAVREPGDLDRALRAARHLDKLGAADQARMLLSRWVESDPHPPGAGGPGPALTHRSQSASWREAALELATYERRAGDRERAAELWRAAWLSDPGCPDASEAWAKHLEHHAADFAGALRVARASRLPCAHRIARLEARLERRSVVERHSVVVPPEPVSLADRRISPSPPLLARADESDTGAVVRYRLLR